MRHPRNRKLTHYRLSSDQLHPRAVACSRRQGPVAGDERRVQRFRERHICGIVGCQVLPKLPEERMTIRAAAPGQPWDGRSDMVILRLASQNRMVTKGYRKGVYEWVSCFRGRPPALKLVADPFP